MKKETVLSIVDSCFHEFASSYRNEARKKAGSLYDKIEIESENIDLPDELIEFNEEVDRMMCLYKSQRYTQAEELRDELAKRLDDIMSLDSII